MTRLEGRDIICLSTHYWDERRYRKQEFMDRFRARNRVLYVEPSFSMARSPEQHLRGVASNSFGRPRLVERGERLWTLQPPRGLPYWTKPRIGDANYLWFAATVASAARRIGFSDAVLWVYQPAYARARRMIPHRQLVFDLVDDLAGYLGTKGSAVEEAERRVTSLAASSDLLVTTSPLLEDKYGHLARHSAVVPNGYDAAAFATAAASATRPPALEGVEVPVLGLVGTLFSFLDFELLRGVAERNRDKLVVLLGPIEASVREEVERLLGEPNVRHIPPVAKEEVPRYVACFSVCLNAFKTGRVADNVSPLKVYEYLAMGKPVVSTPMAGLQREPVAPAIAFASGLDDYCKQIEECLADSPEQSAERRKLVEPYSWDRLFAGLDALCAGVL